MDVETSPEDKKKYSELLTPQWLAKEMIEKFIELNGSLESLKIIEPCCGKGVFLVELLNHKAKIENLYWNDINPINVQFCNLLLGVNKGTNIDALTIDYSQYDLVITNPPYS